MELRKRAGLTQQELADAIGLRSNQTVSNWEKNKAVPQLTPEQTLVLCQKLNCSLQDLVNLFPKKLTPSI